MYLININDFDLMKLILVLLVVYTRFAQYIIMENSK